MQVEILDIFVRLKVENFKLLSDLGIDPNILSQYQILCLPENIVTLSEDSDLVDSEESIILSKLLKEEGAKCANSYDLGLNTRNLERRGLDIWLGSIWILDKVALPLVNSVVGRLLGEKIQKKLENSQKVEKSEETKVYVTLKIVGRESAAEIIYNGDAKTFMKVLKGINDE